MTYRLIGITLLVATFLGCGSEERNPGNGVNRESAPSVKTKSETHDRAPLEHKVVSAPFEYKVISRKEMMHDWRPQVCIELRTTNEVAKKTTKEDLGELWQHIAPTLGDRRVFLYLRTPVPGAVPWAVITRLNIDGEWKVDITIHEYGIDAQPYYFVNEIDRSVQYQSVMIVTLPMVNRLNKQLVRRGWKVTARQEDFFNAESKRGSPSVSVTLDPEGIDIHAFMAEENTFLDTVDLVFGELGIAVELKKKLYSVFGSPKYMRVVPGEAARWSWKIADIEVTYLHLPGIDNLNASYAR